MKSMNVEWFINGKHVLNELLFFQSPLAFIANHLVHRLKSLDIM